MKLIKNDADYIWWISGQLASARIRAGLSQKKAAELSFVSVNTISNYERGRNCPTAVAIMRLASVYGIDDVNVLMRPDFLKGEEK